MRRFLFLTLALLLLAGCSGNDQTTAEKARSVADTLKSLEPGDKATDFYYKDMDEKPFRLSEKRGQVVLIYFWRMKCDECRESMKSLEALHRKYGKRGLLVVAIGADNMHSAPLSKVVRFLEDGGFTFVNIRDDNGLVSEAFNVLKIPEAYLIDKNGTVAAVISGKTDWMDEENTRLIEPLL